MQKQTGLSCQRNRSLSLGKALSNFIFLARMRYTRNTVTAYESDITLLITSEALRRLRVIDNLKASHIIAFLREMRALGHSEMSIRRYYTSAKAFCGYLIKHRYLSHGDPFLLIDPPAPDRAPSRIPSKAEVSRMLQVTTPDNHCGARNRAILETLYSTGLMAQQLCSLRLSDFQRHYLLLRVARGRKKRHIPLTKAACDSVLYYIEQFRGSRDGNLFLTKESCILCKRQLHFIVDKAAQDAGALHVSPHAFRHACSVHLMESSDNLKLIQTLMGYTISGGMEIKHEMDFELRHDLFHLYHPRDKPAWPE